MKAVNLLPPDLRGTATKAAAPAASPAPPASGGAGPFVVLGVLAIALVALAGYILTSNQIKDREAELARVKADTAAAVAQANALKPYADFQAMATARIATVQALAGSRFDWEQGLRDLARALPADVHLTSLKGSLGSSQTGAAAAPAAPASPSIELAGCTRSHRDVAELMSRLRIVRGVTGISLRSSDKGASTAVAPAAPATATGDRPAKLCPGGTPPTFTMTVRFGSAPAPPTGTAQPAPSASATPAPAGGATTSPVSASQGASTR